MAGITRLKAEMSITTPDGLVGPLSLQAVTAVNEWVGPSSVQVPTGTTEDVIFAFGPLFGVAGLTTVTDLMITADQPISVTYGNIATNEPIPMAAHKFHLMSGTSLTVIGISNNSGNLANVTMWVAGV